MFNIYSTDFLDWKDFVDLKKIRLKPEKAVVNEYKEFIDNRVKVKDEVLKYIGVPYLWGGENPQAFDCSGLVQWTLKKTHNILIPRSTILQYSKWFNYFNTDFSKVKEGDLVYFKTYGTNPVSHVGVYIGNNKFVHAPNSNKEVMISNLDGYWKRKLVGFIDLNIIIEFKA